MKVKYDELTVFLIYSHMCTPLLYPFNMQSCTQSTPQRTKTDTALHLLCLRGVVAANALSAPSIWTVLVFTPIAALAQIFLRGRGRTLQAFLNVSLSLFLLVKAGYWLCLLPCTVLVCTLIQDNSAVPAIWDHPGVSSTVTFFSMLCTIGSLLWPAINTVFGLELPAPNTLCSQPWWLFALSSFLAVGGSSPREALAAVVWQVLFTGQGVSPLLIASVLASSTLEFRTAADGLQEWLFRNDRKSGTPLETLLMFLVLSSCALGTLAHPCEIQIAHVIIFPALVMFSSGFILFGVSIFKRYCNILNANLFNSFFVFGLSHVLS